MQLNDVLLALSVLSYVTTTQVNAWSPTNGYAPGNVSCPGGTLIRSATGLSQNETEWLKKRNPIAKSALHDFLTRGTTNFSNTDLVEKLFSDDKNVPKVGIAVSGGGYRAMLMGAGMVAAMDDRTYGADESGLGGLLQGTTYFAGLSGGNWLTTTLAWNNWTSVQDILNNLSATNTSSIWDLENSVLSPGGANRTLTAQIFGAIAEEIDSKVAAGFNISLVDVWGRALSRYFFPNLPEAGSALTWSSIRDFDVFKDAGMPFPISVADGKYPGSTISSTNSTVFEFNPFEMGSWDPSLNAFTDVRYLGSKVDNGLPIENDQCIAGFDNVGFITGTSSDIFNLVSGSSFTTIIAALAEEFLPDPTSDDNDIGIYAPNPFKGISTTDSNYPIAFSKSDTLYLVDGGEDGEVIPFEPLLQKERDVDVIFALDNSDDTDERWPNGNSLVQTYQRQFTSQGRHFAFPYVPTTEVFVKEGLNKRPTFFGCDASNLTELAYVPPLVVYVPNTEYSYASNTSTFQLSYDLEERVAMIQNGFEAMTMGNLTKDPDFVGCISCAIMRRKQESLNIALPDECEKCFSTYCWNDKSTSISSNLTTSSNSSTAATTLTSGHHNTTLLSSMSTAATGKANSISSAATLTSGHHNTTLLSSMSTTATGKASSISSAVTLTGGYHNTTLLSSVSTTATGKANSISSAATLTGGHHDTTLLSSVSTTATGEANSVSSAATLAGDHHGATLLNSVSTTATGEANSVSSAATLAGDHHGATLLNSVSTTATGEANSVSSAATLAGDHHGATLLNSVSTTATGEANSVSSAATLAGDHHGATLLNSVSTTATGEANSVSSAATLAGDHHGATLLNSVSTTATGEANSISSAATLAGDHHGATLLNSVSTTATGEANSISSAATLAGDHHGATLLNSVSTTATGEANSISSAATLTGGHHDTTLLSSVSTTATGEANSVSSAATLAGDHHGATLLNSVSTTATGEANSVSSAATLAGDHHGATLLNSVSTTATGKANSISSASSSTIAIFEARGAGNMLNAKNVLGTMALIRVIYSLL